MKAAAPGKSGSRRTKIGRQSRDLRRRYRHNAEDDMKEDSSSMGIYWYLLGFSILLVAGLSFVNFLALPDLHSPAATMGAYFPSLRGGMHVVDRSADPLQFAPVTPGGGSGSPNNVPFSGSASAVAMSPFSSMYDQSASSAVSALPPGLGNSASDFAAREATRPMLPEQSSATIAARESQSLPAATQGSSSLFGQPHQFAPQQASLNQPALLSLQESSSALGKQVAIDGGIAVLEGDSWFRLSKNVDANEVTFGAWIFLPNAPVSAFPQSSMSMKTIASTKISGCRADVQDAQGWGLFVHEWGTFNQQLRLSWTDSHLACNELYSDTDMVPYDKWVHVGFSLSEARDSVRLLLNGKVIADNKKSIGSMAKASQRASLSDASMHERRLQNAAGSMLVGAHLPQHGDAPHVQSHCFFGFLGDMRILHTSPEDDEQLKKIMTVTAEELLVQNLVTSSKIVVQVQFKASAALALEKPQLNLADGQPLMNEGTGRQIQVVAFTERPRHPWFSRPQVSPQRASQFQSNNIQPGQALAAVPGASQQIIDEPAKPLVPMEIVEPAALKASWPAEWTSKFTTAVLEESQRKADGWSEEMRAAMVHTWRGYRSKAWGHDDLKPVSGHYKDWCRLGITILDALTTLWLMGLKDEFEQSKQWLKENPLPTPGGHGMHSLFEISIRGLGGLLGAFALSSEQIFLENAQRLADTLLHAFNTPSGMPMAQIDVGTGAARWHSWVHFAVLAEVTTVQLEMRYLSHLVNDNAYKKAADKAFDAVLNAAGERGIIPLYLTTKEEVPRFGNGKISMGAMGDSYYEYLIKQWVQNGKKEDRLKNTWKQAMSAMIDQLVRKTQGGLTYICEKDNGNLRHRMDHLACFVAGMLMMGAKELPPDEVDPRWETTATGLTETCYQMYKRTASGLSPEYVVFHPERGQGQDMTTPHDAPHNLLRPEAAEALYYMHYYTGDPKYREQAHDFMQAFDRHSKARYGYAAVRDVRSNPPQQRDDMESFWAAETLKYLFLIMKPRSHLSMTEFVFNTEAHPFRRWVD